jgi:arginase family enzyme
MSLWIGGGEKEPFWMPAFDADPPGGGYLTDCLDLMRTKLGGRKVIAVEVTMKRPRGDDAVRAVVAERFVQAMQEIADSPAPVARRKRR